MGSAIFLLVIRLLARARGSRHPPSAQMASRPNVVP